MPLVAKAGGPDWNLANSDRCFEATFWFPVLLPACPVAFAFPLRIQGFVSKPDFDHHDRLP